MGDLELPPNVLHALSGRVEHIYRTRGVSDLIVIIPIEPSTGRCVIDSDRFPHVNIYYRRFRGSLRTYPSLVRSLTFPVSMSLSLSFRFARFVRLHITKYSVKSLR